MRKEFLIQGKAEGVPRCARLEPAPRTASPPGYWRDVGMEYLNEWGCLGRISTKRFSLSLLDACRGSITSRCIASHTAPVLRQARARVHVVAPVARGLELFAHGLAEGREDLEAAVLSVRR